MFQFSSKYSLLDEEIKKLKKKKKRKNVASPYTDYFVIIVSYFRPFYQSMRTEIITFYRALLFSERFCCIPCN